MKKAVSLGLGVTTVLAWLPMATVHAGQNPGAMSTKSITLNGLSVASPVGFAARDGWSQRSTSYVQLYTLIQVLQDLGIKSRWDGTHWWLDAPGSSNPNSQKAQLGSLPLKVFLNGAPVQAMSMLQAPDPTTGRSTTFIPVYYAMQLLRRMNITSTWNGTTWALMVANRPVYGGTLHMDVNQPHDLDPAHAYDTNSINMVEQVYDTLVTNYGPDEQVKPSLAESYEVSSDGLTYTFHIRQGVRFSNGDPLTAQSFVDEFYRVINHMNGSPGQAFLDPIIAGSDAYSMGNSSTISGISTPDDHTLVIHLTAPEPFFLQVLSMPFFSAIDQSYVDKVGSRAFDSTSMMGTGPFELASASAGQYVLKRNPYYWRTDSFGNPLPYLNQIAYTVNPSLSGIGLDYLKGKTDILGAASGGVPASMLTQFESTPSVSQTLLKQPENAVYYLGMNASIAPFNDSKLRVALEYAIDKTAIINQALNGAGVAANQPLPPNIPGYVQSLPSVVDYTYNPSMAESLLAAAGYQPGQVSITLTTPNDSTTLKTAALVQANLWQVGIQCKIETMSWPHFLDQTEQGKSAFYILGWLQDYPDASDFLNTLFNSNQAAVNNMSDYSNPQVDAWLNQAQTDLNPQERLDLYHKVTVQVMQDAAWIPLYYPENIYATQPWVHGYYISPMAYDPLSTMWLDPGHR